MSEQPNLFGVSPVPSLPVFLREEERFGRADARSGLGLRNYYSRQIFNERLDAYERGFREEREAQRQAG